MCWNLIQVAIHVNDFVYSDCERLSLCYIQCYCEVLATAKQMFTESVRRWRKNCTNYAT